MNKAALARLVALFEAGDYKEVERRARAYIAKDKKDGVAWKALGTALEKQERDSLPAMQRAIKLLPLDAQSYFNLGNAYKNRGMNAEAQAFYQRAIILKPNFAEAYSNMGNTLKELGRHEEALKSYWVGMRLAPHLVEIQMNCGNSLAALGRHAEAIKMFECAIAIKDDFIAAHNAMIFVKDLDPTTTPQSAFEERKRWAAKFADPQWKDVKHPNDPSPERKLRIGYVSGDFREHSAARVFGGMLIQYDRASFEVFAYHNSKRKEDHYTDHFRKSVDHWRKIANMHDDEVAELIRKDEIDILVDLSGHTDSCRLNAFALRPAPIQITAWGYVTGTGMKAMDVIFADPVLIPPEEKQFFTEEVRYLPAYGGRLYLEGENGEPWPEVSELPALHGDGLVTFGSLNRFCKMSPEVYEMWANVLKAVPNSGLVIKAGELVDQQSRDMVLEKFVALGIETGRLIIRGGTPWVDHMSTYREIDIVLDTFPQTGGATTMEALMMGVPVVTLRHPTVAGRPTAAILTALGMTDWIAETKEQYVQIAKQKAWNLATLADLRKGLRAHFLASPVGDNAAYCRAVETEYRDLWRRWCARRAVKAPAEGREEGFFK